ncbi:MAG: C39 family peptidase [Deltaproteobacteria bacterium]|nr:C39 family peptidase [Deltaproteobacteria bacterium]
MKRARVGWLIVTGLWGCASQGSAVLPLPDVRQSTSYTCGAAALLSVLAYFGEEQREDRLAFRLGATEDKGVNPEAILRVAREYGLTAELREGMKVEDLEVAVRNGSPVIVALQAWVDQPTDFGNDWDDGHYAVVVGVDGNEVIFEDPSVLGSHAVLSRTELERRWHDTDGVKMYRNMGIVVGGRAPKPPPARIHMD